MHLDEYIATRAAEEPNAIAIVFNGFSLTYEALERHVNKLVKHFQDKLRVRKNRTVGVYLPRSIEQVIAFIAIMRLRAVYIPLDPAIPQNLAEDLIDSCKITCIITTPFFAPALAVSEKTSCPSIEINVVSNNLNISLPPAEFHKSKNMRDINPIFHTDIAYVISTSGTTGKPKVVPIKYSGLQYWTKVQKHLFTHLSKTSRILAYGNIGGDPNIWEYMTAWVCGGSLFLVDDDTRYDFNKLADFIIQNKITDAILTPAVVKSLDLEIIMPLWAAAGLKTLYCVGDACSKRVLQLCEKYGIKFVNLYGPTEATFGFSAKACDSSEVDSQGRLPIGAAYGNEVKGYVLDDNYNPVPEGVEGNFYIESPFLSDAYIDNQVETNKNFLRIKVSGKEKRLFRTGDRMIYSKGKYYFVTKMEDDNPKVRGQTVDSLAVEHKLEQCPGIKQAGVVVREINGVPRVIAFVMTQGGFEPKKIFQYFRGQLPSASYPSIFVQLDKMPLNAALKLNRRELKKIDLDKQNIITLSPSSYIAPRNALEKKLADMWEELLVVKDISIDTPFLFVGGDSTNITRVLGKIREMFDVDILASQCVPFEELTIEKLALIIFEARFSKHIKTGALNHLIVQAKVNTANLEPLFLFPPITGNSTTYTKFIAALDTKRSVYTIDLPGLFNELDVCTDVVILAKCLLMLIEKALPKNRGLCLAGWSFGATLVVEIQRQLESQQIIPGFVGLIDGMAPVLLKQMSSPAFADHLMELIRHFSELFNSSRENSLKFPDNLQDIIRNLSKEQQIVTAFNALETSEPDIKRTIETTKANLLACLFYMQPHYLSGSLQRKPHIYVCEETGVKVRSITNNYNSQYTLGWCDSFPGSTREHADIRGSHLSLMSDPESWVGIFSCDMNANSSQMVAGISRYRSSESNLTKRIHDGNAELRQMLIGRDQVLGDQAQMLAEQWQEITEMRKAMTEMQSTMAQMLHLMQRQNTTHEHPMEQLQHAGANPPASSRSSSHRNYNFAPTPPTSSLATAGSESPLSPEERSPHHEKKEKKFTTSRGAQLVSSNSSPGFFRGGGSSTVIPMAPTTPSPRALPDPAKLEASLKNANNSALGGERTAGVYSSNAPS